jgi:hypothetical protein
VVRVAFTVALTVAVFAATVPAVELAGVQRSDAQARSAAEELVESARTLAAGNDAVPPGDDPARRVVTVDLPSDGFASAPLRSFEVGPPPDPNSGSDGHDSAEGPRRGADPALGSDDPDATRIAWRVAGGDRYALLADGVRIRPAAEDALRVAGGGRVTFSLRLVSRDGRPVVLIDCQRC